MSNYLFEYRNFSRLMQTSISYELVHCTARARQQSEIEKCAIIFVLVVEFQSQFLISRGASLELVHCTARARQQSEIEKCD